VKRAGFDKVDLRSSVGERPRWLLNVKVCFFVSFFLSFALLLVLGGSWTSTFMCGLRLGQSASTESRESSASTQSKCFDPVKVLAKAGGGLRNV
jgi:hypothetical protein